MLVSPLELFSHSLYSKYSYFQKNTSEIVCVCVRAWAYPSVCEAPPDNDGDEADEKDTENNPDWYGPHQQSGPTLSYTHTGIHNACTYIIQIYYIHICIREKC